MNKNKIKQLETKIDKIKHKLVRLININIFLILLIMSILMFNLLYTLYLSKTSTDSYEWKEEIIQIPYGYSLEYNLLDDTLYCDPNVMVSKNKETGLISLTANLNTYGGYVHIKDNKALTDLHCYIKHRVKVTNP